MKLLFAGFFIISCIHAYQGFIAVPIADCVDINAGIRDAKGILHEPCQIISIHEGRIITPRLAQLLLHEPVEVLEEDGDLVKITTDAIHFLRPDTHKKINTFWVATSAVRQMTPELQRVVVKKTGEKTVTLREPLVTASGIILSVGTRFNVKEDGIKQLSVYWYNPDHKKVEVLCIPRNKCIAPSSDKRSAFVSLLQSIAGCCYKTPYVWGGASVAKRFLKISYRLVPSPCKKGKRAYELIQQPKGPWAGCDCSGLVRLGLQALDCCSSCAMNSATLNAELPHRKANEQWRDGDILYIPGHVAIISDLKKNLVIEARTPEHGYGYVHEVPISELFKGINNFDDLRESIKKQQNVHRIDRYGKTVTWCPVTILSTDLLFGARSVSAVGPAECSNK